MARMLVGSIDLSKLDKTKVVTTDKNGKPFENGAKYLNVVVWLNDENDQYGNIASIQESISKEEREGGAKATYIGNLKDLQTQSSNQVTSTNSKPQSQGSGIKYEDSDLPF